MSCRRADIRNLKGCRIGEVGVRGCSRGCCPYSDEETSENVRFHLITRGAEHRDREMPHPNGREGLYYDRCQSSYRPKFICARKECRRGFKPFFDEEKAEYRIDEWQNWKVRPLPERNEGVREALENGREMDRKSGRNPEIAAKRRNVVKLETRYFHTALAGGGREDQTGEERQMKELTPVELQWLRSNDPNMWWIEINRNPLTNWEADAHAKRCPGCGKEGLKVGSNFRIPAKKDEKAWKRIEEMIENGNDLVAKFSVCATSEIHEDMVDEALRLLGSADTIVSWEEEKKNRIEALGLKWEPRSKSASVE